jgi:hypothetical protein
LMVEKQLVPMEKEQNLCCGGYEVPQMATLDANASLARVREYIIVYLELDQYLLDMRTCKTRLRNIGRASHLVSKFAWQPEKRACCIRPKRQFYCLIALSTFFRPA